MSVHDFGKRAAGHPQGQNVTVTQEVPAFRADDSVLDRVWRAIEARCAEGGTPSGTLTVYRSLRGSQRAARERHRYEYQSVDDLRRAARGPGVLREYALDISSPWDEDHRRVRFAASGRGPATIEAIAADAEWCREVVEAVLDLLRPHGPWYAVVHRIGEEGTFHAFLGVAAVTMWAALRRSPLGFGELAVYLAALALILALEIGRRRLFPAADIRVLRRPSSVPTPGWPSAVQRRRG